MATQAPLPLIPPVRPLTRLLRRLAVALGAAEARAHGLDPSGR